MAKWTNCKVCGQRCEDQHFLGIFCLLFGLPFSWGSFCCDECKRKWAGGRVWFGKKWLHQVIGLLIVAVIIVLALMFMA